MKKAVQPEERGRGVAAAAAEAGAVRDAFGEGDAELRLDAARGAEKPRGADDEIGVIGGKRGVVAGEVEAAGVAGGDVERVEERDRADEAVDLVKAVVAPAVDARA